MQTSDSLLFVPIPDDVIYHTYVKSKNAIYIKIKGGDFEYIDLPSGSWRIVCATDEVTEEIAASIYADRLVYDNGGPADEFGIEKIYQPMEEDGMPLDTALEVHEALLTHLGIKGRHLIIVKE